MQHVTFPTQSPVLFRDLQRGKPLPAATVGRGKLYLPMKPVKNGPAVVLLEGLGGLKDAREHAYGAFLAEQGYVTLVVDSFGARRVSRLPHVVRALWVTEAMLVADAYAALRFLRGHPAVDPEKVFVFGFSYGGMVSVITAYEQIRNLFAADGERFAGHVSFYGCSVPRVDRPETTGNPVLMVLGALDRNVSVERTRIIADDLRHGGSPTTLEILDDVYHQWDGGDLDKRFVWSSLHDCAVRMDRAGDVFDEISGARMRGLLSRAMILGRGTSFSGYHILHDADATREARRKLVDFLDRQSGKQRRPEVRREAPPERHPAEVALLGSHATAAGPSQ